MKKLIFVLLVSCLAYSGAISSDTCEENKLRVALFPYIPDAGDDKFKGMVARIKTEFEQAYKGIELRVRPIDAWENFYDVSFVRKLLIEEQYDVVEVDALLLQELLRLDLLSGWRNVSMQDWHPDSVDLCLQDSEIVAVPHWMCGYYLFTDENSVAFSSEHEKLQKAFGDKKPNLAADFLGSFNLPSIYIDCYNSIYPQRDLPTDYKDLDVQVISRMQNFLDVCRDVKSNPALDGTYHEAPENLVNTFMSGKVGSVIGYSEFLHQIRKSQAVGKKKLIVRPDPFNPKNPIRYLDVFVMPKGISERKKELASKFADYMTSCSTYQWIMLSEDVALKARIPRYLLPATMEPYSHVVNDGYYAAFAAFLKIEGLVCPNNPSLYDALSNKSFSKAIFERLNS